MSCAAPEACRVRFAEPGNVCRAGPLKQTRRALEAHPETELRAAILTSDRLPIVREAALDRSQCEILTIEDVEGLCNHIDGNLVGQRNPLL